VNFTHSSRTASRLSELVPGGCHTFAKGSDQFPENAPIIARGHGCHVWDVDGNEFIEYGSGVRSVTLGHCYPPVIEAIKGALALGNNFTRPHEIELKAASTFLSLIDAEMVKFGKLGTSADTGALKLARAYTGREKVAICWDHPYFGHDEWAMSRTTTDGGIPRYVRELTLTFRYNDIDGLRALFDEHPDQISAVFLEPTRTEEPNPGFLEGVRSLCTARGALLVFDEIITGFRFHLNGAQKLYGVKPDLSTFGKAVANGFSVSALCGRRDIMRLGGREREQDNVYLMSTTHGAEVCSLAAAIATMETYRSEPVIETLYRQGERLRDGMLEAIARHDLGGVVTLSGRPCNLLYGTRGPDGEPSQAFRTLFLQELLERGVLAPNLIVGYSHSDADIDRTIDAINGALGVYARALEGGVDEFLAGRPSRHVFDRK
jgi:glutamate-1-semialdehyde 2,1-aminomutase